MVGSRFIFSTDILTLNGALEGVNGRLSNQDLVNSFERIARSSGVPTVLYDHIDWRDSVANRAELEIIPPWAPSFLRDNHDAQTYAFQAKNVLRHVGYQARGQPSGVHGLFHQCVSQLSPFSRLTAPQVSH